MEKWRRLVRETITKPEELAGETLPPFSSWQGIPCERKTLPSYRKTDVEEILQSLSH
jgi:hypothetical protein